MSTVHWGQAKELPGGGGISGQWGLQVAGAKGREQRGTDLNGGRGGCRGESVQV